MSEIEAKRKWLAENVLGWSEGKTVYQWKKECDYMLDGNPFEPDQDISQAFMILDTFFESGWLLYSNGEEHVCDITFYDVIHSHSSEAKENAIFECTLQASGYYNEHKNKGE